MEAEKNERWVPLELTDYEQNKEDATKDIFISLSADGQSLDQINVIKDSLRSIGYVEEETLTSEHIQALIRGRSAKDVVEMYALGEAVPYPWAPRFSSDTQYDFFVFEVLSISSRSSKHDLIQDVIIQSIPKYRAPDELSRMVDAMRESHMRQLPARIESLLQNAADLGREEPLIKIKPSEILAKHLAGYPRGTIDEADAHLFKDVVPGMPVAPPTYDELHDLYPCVENTIIDTPTPINVLGTEIEKLDTHVSLKDFQVQQFAERAVDEVVLPMLEKMDELANESNADYQRKVPTALGNSEFPFGSKQLPRVSSHNDQKFKDQYGEHLASFFSIERMFYIVRKEDLLPLIDTTKTDLTHEDRVWVEVPAANGIAFKELSDKTTEGTIVWEGNSYAGRDGIGEVVFATKVIGNNGAIGFTEDKPQPTELHRRTKSG